MKETREKDMEEMERKLYERKRQGGEYFLLRGPSVEF